MIPSSRIPQQNVKTELERFLTELRNYVGARAQGKRVIFVVEGTPISYVPSMYPASILQEALDSGEVEKRVLTIRTAYRPDITIDIFAAKEKQASLSKPNSPRGNRFSG